MSLACAVCVHRLVDEKRAAKYFYTDDVLDCSGSLNILEAIIYACCDNCHFCVRNTIIPGYVFAVFCFLHKISSDTFLFGYFPTQAAEVNHKPLL